jgi:hypothetical protein
MVPKTPQTVPRAWGADQAKLHERDRLREDWRLFEGMTLARSGGLPTGGDFAYEVKWAASGRSSRRKGCCGSRAMHREDRPKA